MKVVKQMEWTAEKVSRFWDYLSRFPEHYFTFQFGDILVNRLARYFKDKKTILDYGCGVGYLIPHLLKRGFQVTGLEFSGKSIEIVNDQFGKSPNFKGAFLHDELLNKNEKFDVIFVIEVIEHLDDATLSGIFQNIKKLLAPNGIVIFTTPNNEDLSLSMVFCPDCEVTFHRWQHVRSWTRESLTHHLSQHGFSVLHCGVTDFSASVRKNWKTYLKYLGKRFLGMPAPHLFCVAKVN